MASCRADWRLIEMPVGPPLVVACLSAARLLIHCIPNVLLLLLFSLSSCPALRTLNLANSQLNRKVKMSLIASIYLNEFSLAECRARYKFPVLPFIASSVRRLSCGATNHSLPRTRVHPHPCPPLAALLTGEESGSKQEPLSSRYIHINFGK